ncbi:MAG: hypothetical protein KH405_00420, partial [Firmicutes bacterium]|nr:hypothetical protein [Bacillota bacterium]
MKKRVLSVCLAIALFFCAFAMLSACERNLKDREITPTIEEIWQDYSGTVWVEVRNLGDYLQDKDAAQQLEFSVNGGNWYSCSYNNSIETTPGNGIYNILYQFCEEEYTEEYTNIIEYRTGDGQLVQPGTTITVSVRTPKNYYYKPSAASEQKTYTLKSKRQNAISLSAVCRFSRDVYSSAPTFSSTEQDENRFVFYYQESNPRVVKIGVPASTWDESEKQYRHYIRELTEEEKATVAGFGLEYKVIPYNEKYLKT